MLERVRWRDDDREREGIGRCREGCWGRLMVRSDDGERGRSMGGGGCDGGLMMGRGREARRTCDNGKRKGV